ncbi:hypothetical protein [Luteibacter sp. UNC138MFCol5.1]|uniref:hypothetical protein n=1 Tax=Luteibacter sp. UNC138MFCol5.1 TaxID=1502774 RepID=UPI000B7CAE13|nr:hypothetical protein [Luteibacter sp. UNC138MFCol5.1]
MADGGRSENDELVIEAVARRIVAAFGQGNHWQPDWHRASPWSDNVTQDRAGLMILRRGRTEEKAVRDNGKILIPAHRTWSSRHVQVALPRRGQDFGALAAFAFAKLDGPLEAMLMLYATGDVPRYWPAVERYALACVRSPFASEAVTDAVQRILCGRAAISMDDRARQLGVRATGYRRLTRRIERLMREWLRRAAGQYLAAMG